MHALPCCILGGADVQDDPVTAGLLCSSFKLEHPARPGGYFPEFGITDSDLDVSPISCKSSSPVRPADPPVDPPADPDNLLNSKSE